MLGATGAGTIEHFGVEGQIDVVVGTLGKALGTVGAYVGGSQELVELLVSRSRSFIFTTGTPPAMAAATLEALRIAQVEGWRREAVRERARHLRERLRESGLNVPGEADGHIVPVIIGDARRTMELVANLRRRGFSWAAYGHPPYRSARRVCGFPYRQSTPWNSWTRWRRVYAMRWRRDD